MYKSYYLSLFMSQRMLQLHKFFVKQRATFHQNLQTNQLKSVRKKNLPLSTESRGSAINGLNQYDSDIYILNGMTSLTSQTSTAPSLSASA